MFWTELSTYVRLIIITIIRTWMAHWIPLAHRIDIGCNNTIRWQGNFHGISQTAIFTVYLKIIIFKSFQVILIGQIASVMWGSRAEPPGSPNSVNDQEWIW
jgi:hypothetical protein